MSYNVEYWGIDAEDVKFSGSIVTKSKKIKNWGMKINVESIKLPLKHFGSKATIIK